MIDNRLFIAAIIAATILASHGNSLKSDFVYDDRLIILENPYIAKFSNLKWAFSEKYFAISGEATYRPAATFSYYLDRAIWGLNPFGYHLTNLIIHFASALAVFFLSWLIWANKWASLLASLIFAAHPALSEAVNAIGYREDLLSAALFLGSLIFALKAHRRELVQSGGPGCVRRRLATLSFSLISAVLYLIALLSKEMAITNPLILALIVRHIDGKKEGRGSFFRPFELLPLLLSTTAVYLYMRFGLFSNPDAPEISYPAGSFIVSIMTMPKVVAHYVALSFFPFNLNPHYVVRPIASPGELAFIIPSSFLLGLALAAFFARQKASYFSFGALWFFITLLPVYNLVPLYNIKAERYLYLPFFGVAAPLGILAWKSILHLGRASGAPLMLKAALSLVSAILAIFTLLSFNRSFAWRNEYVLWLETVSSSPNSEVVRLGLGWAYEKMGSLDKAMTEYRTALLLNPKFLLAWNNVGSIYHKKGLAELAIANFQKALDFGQPYAKTHKNLGAIYGRMGRYDRSIHQLKSAIAIKRDYFEAKNYLGVVYKNKYLLDKARAEFEGVLKEGVDNVETFQGLGNTYHAMNLFGRAIFEYKRGLAVDSEDAGLHKNLGLTYLYEIGDKVRARTHLATSLLIDPYQKEAAEMRRIIGAVK